MDFVKENGLKAFVQVFVAPNLRIGFHNLMVGAGLGAMTCNTVVFPLLDHKKLGEDSTTDTDGEELDILGSDRNISIGSNINLSRDEMGESSLIDILDRMY